MVSGSVLAVIVVLAALGTGFLFWWIFKPLSKAPITGKLAVFGCPACILVAGATGYMLVYGVIDVMGLVGICCAMGVVVCGSFMVAGNVDRKRRAKAEQPANEDADPVKRNV